MKEVNPFITLIESTLKDKSTAINKNDTVDALLKLLVESGESYVNSGNIAVQQQINEFLNQELDIAIVEEKKIKAVSVKAPSL
jgi:hypothetical protein